MNITKNEPNPGPWYCIRLSDPSDTTASYQIGWSRGPIALVGSAIYGTKGTIEANAHLLAASPELLAACKEGLRAIKEELDASLGDDHPVLDDHREVAKQLEAAIAKAEGSKP